MSFYLSFKTLFQCPYFNVVLSTKEQSRLKCRKNNFCLSTIWRLYCNVLVITLFYKQYDDGLKC